MSDLHDLLHALMGSPRSEACPKKEEPFKAFAWARVSTGKQEERGLSIPEQLREIRSYAARNGMRIVAEFQEAVSAFQHPERRHEFNRMLERARAGEADAIIVHDLSRFGRNSLTARVTIQDLGRAGVEVLSVTDPKVDRETSAGVYMEAITHAKNEAYSREVAFHTRKGCRANVQMRDSETGWCYKNGGQPLFGYRAERLVRGDVKRGKPLAKIIWVPDDSLIAGRSLHEWARHCLVELAGKGASLAELRDFCNESGIPGRRKQYWGISTWHALLQPSVLLQYCGYAVWNVHDKHGHQRPQSEWVIVDGAHPSLLSEKEARMIAAARQHQAADKKKFDIGYGKSRSSSYLLSGGLFRCGRCGANMMGMHTDSGYYYVCGSQPYRRGMGCGPGVYVPQRLAEGEVISGLKELLSICSDPKGFTRKVNEELRNLVQTHPSTNSEATERVKTIDAKIANIRQAIEDGLTDANWANSRLRDLFGERKVLEASGSKTERVPQIDVATAMAYRSQVEKLFKNGKPAECKSLLRSWVKEVKLAPAKLEVEIAYRIPEAVMNGLVAGGGFEPPTFGL
jgi:DNA invertase Pin-like site-specific DNA recombinase